MKFLLLGVGLLLAWIAFNMHRTGRLQLNLYTLEREREPVKFFFCLLFQTFFALAVLVFAFKALAE